MRPVAARGRWIWGLSGLAVAVSFGVPGGWLITSAGVDQGQGPQHTVARVVIVPQPVTTLEIQSSSGPVQVTAGPVPRVRVTERITYGPQDGPLPVAALSVSDGVLTLTGPACVCSVGLIVTVPPGVGVAADTGGSPVTVSGVAAANLDSGGGPAQATGITGPLVVSTDGGPVTLNGLTGPLQADTGGGPLLAVGISSATATVTTGGGQAQIGFTAAPDGVFVTTDGGPAVLALPAGPYALTTRSFGGPQSIGIADDPAAGRSVTVTTGGGPLRIEPANNLPGCPARGRPLSGTGSLCRSADGSGLSF
jgi:hypothetical protein